MNRLSVLSMVKHAISAWLLTGLMAISWSASAEQAIFAGGCFWCIEADFEKLDGVRSAVSGYSGGYTKNPSYEQVSRKKTGHYEVVEIDFDEKKISYGEIVDYFWQHIDPFDAHGQFCDKGMVYRSAIFFMNAEQEKIANASKEKWQKHFGKERVIATGIMPSTVFYIAEAYHQDYYLKNPKRYNFYRWSCGRDQRVNSIWDKVKAKTRI